MSLTTSETPYLCTDPVVLPEVDVMVMQASHPVREDDAFRVAWQHFPTHLLWLRVANPVFKLRHRGVTIKTLATYSDTDGYLSSVDSAMADAHDFMAAHRIDGSTELELVLELTQTDYPVVPVPDEAFEREDRGIRVRNLTSEEGYYYFDSTLFEAINACTSMQAYATCLEDPALREKRIEPRAHDTDHILWDSRRDGATEGMPEELYVWLACARSEAKVPKEMQLWMS